MEIHGIHANNTWKVQLMIVINFISSKDTNEEKGMIILIKLSKNSLCQFLLDIK